MPNKKLPKSNPNVADLETKLATLESKLSRALADYANLEKRFDRESSSVIKFANSSLLAKILDLRDHVESAAKHSSDPSLALLLDLFDKLLAEEQVRVVDTSGVFDPSTMECQETAPGELNKVISVSRPGYTLHDRVLRPARVVVGSGQTSVNKSKS